MNPDDEISLSPEGDRRRREILEEALRATDRRRNVRGMRKIGAIACILLVCGGIVVLLKPFPANDERIIAKIDRTPVTSTKPSAIAPPQPSPVPKRPTVIVEIITAADVKRAWESLDDDQLLATLADAGHPSGIARLNGRSFLLPTR